MLPSVFNDRFFDDFMDFPFERNFWPERTAPRRYEKDLMRTDIRNLENEYEVFIEMPGFKKEDVEIKLDDGYLTISAEKHSDVSDDSDDKYLRRERWYGKCSRSFYVGKELKGEDIKAKMEDGVLKLTVPKKQIEPPKDTTIYIEG